MTSRTRALWLTARPKTLAAAIVPVIVGTALVWPAGLQVQWRVTLFALLSASMIQIGTNFVNDAIDFLKGADKETRIGEARASQQGWFTARAVMIMGITCFAAAMLFGLPLVYQGGWPILIIGVVSLFMGYAYTGGPFPLAYIGLGDLFVVLFFGLVAVGGVFFLESQVYDLHAFVAGLQIGLLATVLIAINNLRDLDQDREVGKKTLAVRLGPKLGRYEVILLFLVAYLLGIYWLKEGLLYAALLPLLSLPVSGRLSWAVMHTPAGRDFNQFLARAAKVHMLFGLLLSIGLILK